MRLKDWSGARRRLSLSHVPHFCILFFLLLLFLLLFLCDWLYIKFSLVFFTLPGYIIINVIFSFPLVLRCCYFSYCILLCVSSSLCCCCCLCVLFFFLMSDLPSYCDLRIIPVFFTHIFFFLPASRSVCSSLLS